ncbi:MAG: hypothetical protein QG608_166 [Actinomycetota bacterium]|nr:hypothetical protein [Actinomycetota bacterium]
MKIAVSADAEGLDAPVQAAFGRCPFLVVVEVQGGVLDPSQVRTVTNTSREAPSGAGVRSVQLLVSTGATVLLTGRCGPKASDALSAAGIEVHSEQAGTVRQVLERFLEQAA